MAVAVSDGELGREELRRRLHEEREQLAEAVEALKKAADLRVSLRARLPLVAVSAFFVAFVMSGGIGATMRFLARRGREGKATAKLGHWALVDRS
jgi:type VI protein secretion system component VasF